MPPLETTDRPQKALLWAANGTDRFGRTKVQSYIQIEVMWNFSRRMVVDAKGNNVRLEAEAVVDRRIDPGSIMRLGDAEDWLGTGSGSGLDDSELYEVITYDEVRDIKGRNVYREVGLMRYRDALPTLT